MKITTDTNVLISATFWTGNSYRILDMVEKKEIELILSAEIIEEYNDVVNRDEITDKVSDKNLITSSIVDKAINEALIIQPKEKLYIVKKDSDDNKIVECAVEGNADYIITQDEHLLELKEFKGIQITTPKDFLEIFENKNKKRKNKNCLPARS